MRLNNKTAIVTGGGSGFGAGIARKFASEGAQVMVVDLNLDAAKAVAAEIGGIAQRANVADGADVKAMAKAAFDAFGTLDILVNNAGFAIPAEIDNELYAISWDTSLAVMATAQAWAISARASCLARGRQTMAAA